MFGLFGRKPGGGSLLADGSFAFFGCLSLLFILMAAPLLALVIVSREGLAELAHNVAGAFGGDRLWHLVIFALLLAALLYLARYVRDVFVAEAEARRPQIHYPPQPTIELYRGFSPAEMRQYLEVSQPQPAALPDSKPSRLPGGQVARRWLGGPPAGAGQEGGGGIGGIGWKR